MNQTNITDSETRDVFTTVDYRYEVFTQSKDGRQLEGDHATRIAIAKNRGVLMLGKDNEAATVCVHDRMARVGHPNLWRFDGVHWQVVETRKAA